MKILYHAIHKTLEYDTLSILTELGHEVFSTGLYGDTTNIDKSHKEYERKEKRYAHNRPNYISGYKTNPEWLKEYKAQPQNIFSYESRSFAFSKSFLNGFDLIYVEHNPALCQQLHQLSGKPTIFNTVSQANGYMEEAIKVLKKDGIKIIRFYESEKFLKDSIEEDALIPQVADETEYKDWRGNIKEVLSVCRGIPSRPIHTNANLLWIVSNSLPTKLIGPGNEGILCSIGSVSYEELKEAYRSYRLFLNLGTKPGGMVYTCIEALMTGCPVVSVGKELGGSRDVGIGYTNAIPNFITNGLNGFYSDNPQELISYCTLLLKEESLAKRISEEGRKLALKHFSKDVIKTKWEDLLNTI